MFLLPSLALGFLFAVLLGGRPSRVLEVRFRLGWTILAALGIQIALFSRLGDHIDPSLHGRVHLLSYAFLLLFAAANLKARTLMPVLLGLVLNAVAIAANGGRMPVSAAAAEAAGLHPGAHTNVSESSHRLGFLGDVFALPRGMPLANVFSIGDLLIGFGMVAFILGVATSTGDEPALSMRRLVTPLRTTAYRRMLAGHLVSQVGDWLTIAALVGWIYKTTGSTVQVAVLLLIRVAPPILGGGLAAFVVDRLPKQHLLFWVELLRSAAVAGALAAVLNASRPLVYVALGVSGALSAISSAILPALVPSLLDDEQLPSANAGLGIAKDLAMAVGAAGAGITLTVVGVVPALAVDVATFFVAASLYSGLRTTPVARSERSEHEPSCLRYLLRQRTLLLLIGSFAAATLATGLTNASLPHFLDATVGLGASGYGFGIAAIAVGLALGEAVAGFARVGPSAGRWIGAGLCLMGGLFALLAFSVNAPTALLLLGGIGFVDGTTDVLYQTVLQRRAEPRYHGRLFTLSSACMSSTMMGAFVAAPVATELIGSGHVILVAGATLLVAGALALAAIAPGEPKTHVSTERPEPVLATLVQRADLLVETARRLAVAFERPSNPLTGERSTRVQIFDPLESDVPRFETPPVDETNEETAVAPAATGPLFVIRGGASDAAPEPEPLSPMRQMMSDIDDALAAFCGPSRNDDQESNVEAFPLAQARLSAAWPPGSA
jgi:Na+/melibiose symporter-like transporter